MIGKKEVVRHKTQIYYMAKDDTLYVKSSYPLTFPESSNVGRRTPTTVSDSPKKVYKSSSDVLNGKLPTKRVELDSDNCFLYPVSPL